jgi:hypothetical protein
LNRLLASSGCDGGGPAGYETTATLEDPAWHCEHLRRGRRSATARPRWGFRRGHRWVGVRTRFCIAALITGEPTHRPNREKQPPGALPCLPRSVGLARKAMRALLVSVGISLALGCGGSQAGQSVDASAGGRTNGCLSALFGPTCWSCNLTNCGSEVAGLDNACTSWVNCVCPNGRAACDAYGSSACGSDIGQAGCPSAFQALANCQAAKCDAACANYTGSCGTSSEGGGCAGSGSECFGNDCCSGTCNGLTSTSPGTCG